MRKIIPYLILNFIVSAFAVLLVLVIWDSTHKNSDPRPPDSFNPIFQNGSATNENLPPLDQLTIEIVEVIGAGDLEQERIHLANHFSSAIDLAGWVVRDEQQNELILPRITVFESGGLVLFSKAGINNAAEIYGNLEDAIFSSGENIKLFDPSGSLRSSFTIP